MDTNTVLIILVVGIVLFVLPLMILIGRETAKQEKARQKEIMSHIDEWTPRICNMLVNKQITLDMTQTQVTLSWGKPSYADQKEITKKGVKIRWVYGTPRQGARYVWFSNARVTKIKT